MNQNSEQFSPQTNTQQCFICDGDIHSTTQKRVGQYLICLGCHSKVGPKIERYSNSEVCKMRVATENNRRISELSQDEGDKQ